MAVVVRTTIAPASAESTIREAVRAIDRDLAISDLERLADTAAESVAHARFCMLLLGFFAGTALMLAAIGVFGVLSNCVSAYSRGDFFRDRRCSNALSASNSVCSCAVRVN